MRNHKNSSSLHIKLQYIAMVKNAPEQTITCQHGSQQSLYSKMKSRKTEEKASKKSQGIKILARLAKCFLRTIFPPSLSKTQNELKVTINQKHTMHQCSYSSRKIVAQ